MDPINTVIRNADAIAKSRMADAAARTMAKDFDRRRKIAMKALTGIDTYAWSMVTVPGAPGRKELMKRITACRNALKEI